MELEQVRQRTDRTVDARDGAHSEATRLSELSPQQWRSGTAAWLGWLFDGLDMHLYTLVAAPVVLQLIGAVSSAFFLIGRLVLRLVAKLREKQLAPGIARLEAVLELLDAHAKLYNNKRTGAASTRK